MEFFNKNGIALIGCGFMGQALLDGWLAKGLNSSSVWIQDPNPAKTVLKRAAEFHLNEPFPDDLGAVVIATKPQLMPNILPTLVRYAGRDTAIVSIAAGTKVEQIEAHLGTSTPIVRAMPNLPASVGAGATALFANLAASSRVKSIEYLFDAVGTVARVPSEDLLHAVTGVSGSGPAYVFAMVEALCAAGMQLGLPQDTAELLARHTIIGAGTMLMEPTAKAEELRAAVTSPGGTTEAGLAELTSKGGLSDLIFRTVNAARLRSKDLGELNGN